MVPPILLGGTYLHMPTKQLVEVLDFELRCRRRRRRALSARTGRYIVRPCSRAAAPFIATLSELVQASSAGREGEHTR